MSWFSNNIGKIGGAILGWGLAPVTAGASLLAGSSWALAGAVGGDVLIDQPKAAKEQAGAVIGTQEQIAAEQLTAQKETAAERLEVERGISAEQYRLTKTQMEFQMGQQQVELLANLFLEQDRTETETRPGARVLTLPSTSPSGILDQVNIWIDRALRA